MRAPFQVLVIPYRRDRTGVRFALLKRRDAGYWQFVAGGGEQGETPQDAARREAQEELGIETLGSVMPLHAMATVPKNCFPAAATWDRNLYVVPEYCFAVEIGENYIGVSDEHTECLWLGYQQAFQLLKWDSNRTALWELNERLGSKDGSEQAAPADADKPRR